MRMDRHLTIFKSSLNTNCCKYAVWRNLQPAALIIFKAIFELNTKFHTEIPELQNSTAKIPEFDTWSRN